MYRVLFGVRLAMVVFPLALVALSPVSETRFVYTFSATGSEADPLGAAGGGQVVPSATRREAFTRLALGITASSFGTGAELATNLGPRLDARLFGNYLNFTHTLTRTGFDITGNLEMPNTGAMIDYYPIHKFPLRISPGYLFFNRDRARADFHARPGATLTINNIDWISDNADPVHGTGRLTLGGSGFIVTAGVGRFVSHSRRRFTFPFEAGVAFIDKPKITIDISGEFCAAGQTQCQPAASFPAFSTNLAQQLIEWNSNAAPFHVYPIVEGGVVYTFRIRGTQ